MNVTTHWNSTILHGVKRELSKFEKDSLPTHHGHALILPGVPGTEVEELHARGYDLRQIHAVEHDQTLADALYEHYFDLVQVHWLEVEEFLRRSQHQFSYMHLDYCSQLKEEIELLGVEATTTKLDEVARIRVSSLASRRSAAQRHTEASWHEHIFDNLCALGETLDIPARASGWARLRATLAANRWHTTQTLGGILVLNHFFGVDLRSFVNECLRQHPYLPAVQGTHMPIAYHAYRYHEPNVNGRNVMYTMWMDWRSLPPQFVHSAQDPSHSNRWALDVLYTVLTQIATPLTDFVGHYVGERTNP